MADGVRVGADQADGTKPKAATDEITSGAYNGMHAGISKLAVGAAHGADLVDVAHPLPVQGAITNFPVGGATESSLAAAAASLSVVDDWDETDRAKVNLIAGQAGVDGGSGAVSAKTQRAVLATDVPLPAGTNAIGKVGHDSTGIGDGRKVVTTAGTAVALASATPAKSVVITAETDNTGIVVVGAPGTVVAALATRRGIPLSAGDTVVLPVDDLADVGLDSIVSGDGVTYVFTS